MAPFLKRLKGLSDRLNDGWLNEGYYKEDYYDEDEDETVDTYDEEEPIVNYESSKVSHFPQEKENKIIVIKPDSMQAAQEISHHLRAGRTVICNFEQVDQKVAQRVIDFITGATYAIEGHLYAVSTVVFVIVPQSATILDLTRSRERYNDDRQYRAYAR